MHYSKYVFCLLVLNRAWSTKTNSLAYEYAKDKDSQPKSHREMERSPLADIGILSSFTKKNSIRSNSKLAEPSFKSEQGIIEVVLDSGVPPTTALTFCSKMNDYCVGDDQCCAGNFVIRRWFRLFIFFFRNI